MSHSIRVEIDWSLAPAWANYAAMDADGDWNFYEEKPEITGQEQFWRTKEDSPWGTVDFGDYWRKSLVIRADGDCGDGAAMTPDERLNNAIQRYREAMARVREAEAEIAEAKLAAYIHRIGRSTEQCPILLTDKNGRKASLVRFTGFYPQGYLVKKDGGISQKLIYLYDSDGWK